jgi:hypothetical protein
VHHAHFEISIGNAIFDDTETQNENVEHPQSLEPPIYLPPHFPDV